MGELIDNGASGTYTLNWHSMSRTSRHLYFEDRMSQPHAASETGSAPKRELNLFDTTSIIVTIILGTGIYMTTPFIASLVPSVGWLFAVWIAGAVLSFVGALCYGELTTMYPRAGGDFFYLSRAYGRDLGFLFAWSELWITRPGNIGALAYVFAYYAYDLFPWAEGQTWLVAGVSAKALALMLFAAIPVIVLTGINLLGVREGKWTQNLLMLLKLGGPLMLLAAGLMFTQGAEAPAAAEPVAREFNRGSVQLALILVLFTFGGWSEIATVGAEVRNPEKNMVRSLLLGIGAITAIYLTLNAVFVHVLGLDGFSKASAVASAAVEPVFGPAGAKLMSLIVTISALGAMSAQIFTGARIFYAMGREHPLYAIIGRWNERGTPVWSLVLQGAATVAVILLFGWNEGQQHGAFRDLVGYTAPLFWMFFTMVGLSLLVFRQSEPETRRPFRVPLFPFTPILFCLMTTFMLYSSVDYTLEKGDWRAFWWLVGGMGVGLIMVFVNRALTASARWQNR